MPPSFFPPPHLHFLWLPNINQIKNRPDSNDVLLIAVNNDITVTNTASIFISHSKTRTIVYDYFCFFNRFDLLLLF